MKEIIFLNELNLKYKFLENPQIFLFNKNFSKQILKKLKFIS